MEVRCGMGNPMKFISRMSGEMPWGRTGRDPQSVPNESMEKDRLPQRLSKTIVSAFQSEGPVENATEQHGGTP
jgi:hypothetical protein